MRFIIIHCILASILGLVARGQLNFKGSPLTENIDYTAEETHFSERNARRNDESLEIDGVRTVAVTNDPFTLSPEEDVVNGDKRASQTMDTTQKDGQVKNGAKKLSIEDEESSAIGSLFDSREKLLPTAAGQNLSDADTPQQSARVSQKTSISPSNVESRALARQLREYPVHLQPNSPYTSALSRDLSDNVGQSQPYAALDESSHNAIYQSYPPSKPAPISSASGQALNKFLQSRTPEESNMALQHYLKIREYAARSNAQSGEANNIKVEQNSYADNTIQSGQVSSQMQQQQIVNSQPGLLGSVQSSVSSDETGQSSYPPGQQYSPVRWNQVGFQSRQDSLVAGPGRRARPYRSQMVGMGGRFRGNPWAQSRIGPGPPLYHHKGPYAGPPPPGFAGKWKPPVQVIYTRPPGIVNGPADNLVSHDDASRWFPDADGDQPSPQNQVLYSQLYAQSYDPHYYNYIANTGKIKPWLYGKLGEPKEKSIWWELFSGFKKHGMKNIMNPMFLLGMTIPTLTLMLTALVHKRSLGRSFSDGHVTEELIEEYARRLREAIECNAKLVNEANSNEELKRCW